MAEEKILTENELDGVSGGAAKKPAKKPEKKTVIPGKDDYYVKTVAVTNGGSVDTTVTVLADTDLSSVTGGSSLTGRDNRLPKRSGIAADATVTTAGFSSRNPATGAAVLADSDLNSVSSGFGTYESADARIKGKVAAGTAVGTMINPGDRD